MKYQLYITLNFLKLISVFIIIIGKNCFYNFNKLNYFNKQLGLITENF